MNISNLRLASGLCALLLAAILAGCGASAGGSSTTTTPTPTTTTATHIALATTASQVKSDNSNSVTITASVLDSGNAVVSGATVNFSTSSGQLSVGSGATASTGQVATAFSAGAATPTNRTATVTATVAGTSISAQIPIQVIGSTLAISSSASSIATSGTTTLTATAKDAGGNAVSGQTLRFSIDASSTGAGNFGGSATATATSGSNGAGTATFTATGAGSVTISVAWLDASGAATQTASTTITVAGSGSAFAVATPSAEPASYTLNTTQSVAVSVPSTISGTTVAYVRLATTLGKWSNAATVIELTPSANVASDTFSTGANSGLATIQIDALDANRNVLATLTRHFALSAAAASAASVSLQANVTTVAPSIGGTTNTATLTATVRDSSNNSVGGASVLFTLTNTTGTGEQILPVIASTDSTGVATATFTSGSQATIGAVTVTATVVGTSVTATKAITVSGQAVSVSFGTATTVSSIYNDTAYQLYITALVVDSTGSPVRGAVVTLDAFPIVFRHGTRDTKCAITSDDVWRNNNDTNHNDILESTEYHYLDSNNVPLNVIVPPHAAAGTVPSTVTTDANGAATFPLIYLKQYASWLVTRITANVTVLGSQSTSQFALTLSPSSADATSNPCVLSGSPFESFGGAPTAVTP